MVKVKNLHGTSDNVPPFGCSSWLDFWKTKKGVSVYSPVRCAVHRYHNAEVGAHVIMVNSYDRSWYIVPLCKAQNASNEEFWVDESMLVKVR